VLEQALALKNEVAGFLELGGGFKALRMDADKLSTEVRELVLRSSKAVRTASHTPRRLAQLS